MFSKLALNCKIVWRINLLYLISLLNWKNIKWNSCVWEKQAFIFELSTIWPRLQKPNPASCWELTRGVKSLSLLLHPAESKLQGRGLHWSSDTWLLWMLGSFMGFLGTWNTQENMSVLNIIFSGAEWCYQPSDLFQDTLWVFSRLLNFEAVFKNGSV